MNISNTILIYTIIILLICGCEEIDIVNITINHEEKIVVQCELMADEYFNGVTLTKTIPLNENHDISRTEITDAYVFIIVGEKQTIPLHYKGEGIYLSWSNFKIKPNEIYELYALVGDKEVYAKTFVPSFPIVNNEEYISDGYLKASVTTMANEVYGAIWVISNNEQFDPIAHSNDFHSITDKREIESERTKLVRTTNLSDQYLTPYYSDNIYLQVYSFDYAYYDYFNTKDNNQGIEDSFSQNGGSIRWNTEGTDVIGMFIGVAKSDLILVKK